MNAASHNDAIDPNSNTVPIRTLSLDFGGSSLKSAVLDENGEPIGGYLIEFIAYPFEPSHMLHMVQHHLEEHDSAIERITLGMPGIIRNGVVVTTPHYICTNGPRTDVSLELSERWLNYDLRTALEESFDCPALVLNDAEVAAAGVTSGEGAELVLTLGTGLGCAFVVDGLLAPHIEVSHAPWMAGRTFDDVLGEKNRSQCEPAEWSEAVLEIIDSLWPVYHWDKLYLGGGNSQKLTTDVRQQMPSRHVTFIQYEAGASGGAKAWELIKASRRTMS